MKCPFCGFIEDKVVDSRESREGDSIRRRRECLKCERRFTSYERIDHIPYMVTKKDQSRETFDRNKVMAGLLRACEKRPIPPAKLDSIVNAVEKYVQESPERERPTSKIGELIMRRLKLPCGLRERRACKALRRAAGGAGVSALLALAGDL